MALMRKEAFERATYHPVFSRSMHLKDIGMHIHYYHDELHTGSPSDQVINLELVIEAIETWTADKKLITRGGFNRYNHCRDKTGAIYRTYQESRRLLHLANLRNNGSRLTNNPRKAVKYAAIDRQHTARQRQIAINGYNDGRILTQGPSNVSFNHQSIRALFDLDRPQSVRSDYSKESDRNSYHHGEEQAIQVLGGYLGNQAFHAISEFLELSRLAQLSPAAVERQLIAAQTGVTSNCSSLENIFRAMHASYPSLFFRQRCTAKSVLNTLSGALPTRPIMVVVGGNTPLYRLVVVSKMYYWGAPLKQMFRASDRTHPGGYHTSLMYEDGRFESDMPDGSVIVEALMPYTGLIKLIN